jgi:S1-C subfamily serine protease
LLDGHEVFLYSAIARPGNSGGPIVSETGHVVGIVTEELTQSSATFEMPFHAGIRTTELVRALSDLDTSLTLPVEDYE